ncbi:MAG: hypothetical protein U5K75_01050 [Ahrensia sp.]|nr:hypothetical protein [Ahrensia sp.]
MSYNKIGDIKAAQGDARRCPLRTYAARTIAARAWQSWLDRFKEYPAATAGRDRRRRGEPEWQRDLSVSYNKIGDIKAAQGDGPAALAAYEDGLIAIVKSWRRQTRPTPSGSAICR